MHSHDIASANLNAETAVGGTGAWKQVCAIVLKFRNFQDILRYLENFWRYLENFWRYLERFREFLERYSGQIWGYLYLSLAEDKENVKFRNIATSATSHLPIFCVIVLLYSIP